MLIHDPVYRMLNRYRLARGMSMQEFAAETGVGMSTVRRALLGIHQPHDYSALALHDYYKRNREAIAAELNLPMNDTPVPVEA